MKTQAERLNDLAVLLDDNIGKTTLRGGPVLVTTRNLGGVGCFRVSASLGSDSFMATNLKGGWRIDRSNVPGTDAVVMLASLFARAEELK